MASHVRGRVIRELLGTIEVDFSADVGGLRADLQRLFLPQNQLDPGLADAQRGNVGIEGERGKGHFGGGWRPIQLKAPGSTREVTQETSQVV